MPADSILHSIAKIKQAEGISLPEILSACFYTYNHSSVVSIYHSIMLITFHLQKTVFFLICCHNPFQLPSRRHRDFPGYLATPHKEQFLWLHSQSAHLRIPDSKLRRMHKPSDAVPVPAVLVRTSGKEFPFTPFPVVPSPAKLNWVISESPP